MKLNDWLLDRFRKIKDDRSVLQIILTKTLIALCAIGLFNGILANQKPILQINNGSVSIPAFFDVWADWTFQKRTRPLEKYEGWVIPTPIRYAYNTIDKKNMDFAKPGQSQAVPSLWYRHWLGTDGLGRDVAAGLTRSLFNSIKIGLLATLFSIIIGTILGSFSAILGDTKVRFNWLQGVLYLVLSFYFVYYLVITLTYFHLVYLGFVIVLFLLIYANGYFWSKSKLKTFGAPFDLMVTKLIEIRKSIPALIWILACLPLFRSNSSVNTVIILSLIGWTTFARVSRAETLNMINNGYIKYIEAVGIGNLRLLLKHILPNIKSMILNLGIFALIGNILLEAGLSFLGLGLPPEEISFGSMLSIAKGNLLAWWMVVFPGGMLFIILLTLRMMVDNIHKTVNS